jgi:hypothetical protein
MATNFADLAAHYWGRMRHWERKVTQRDMWLAREADRLAEQRYGRRKPKDWDRAVYSIECELVDTDRERSVLIGRQQFNQGMHDSSVLQALMRGHKPTAELQVDLDIAASRGLAAAREAPRPVAHVSGCELADTGGYYCSCSVRQPT